MMSLIFSLQLIEPLLKLGVTYKSTFPRWPLRYRMFIILSRVILTTILYGNFILTIIYPVFAVYVFCVNYQNMYNVFTCLSNKMNLNLNLNLNLKNSPSYSCAKKTRTKWRTRVYTARPRHWKVAPIVSLGPLMGPHSPWTRHLAKPHYTGFRQYRQNLNVAPPLYRKILAKCL